MKEPEETVSDTLQDERSRYHAFFMNAPIGIYSYHLSDGQLVDCNHAAVHMFGYDHQDDFLTGESFPSHYVDPASVVELIAILRAGGEVTDVEVPFFRKDHSILWTHCTMYLDGDDTLVGILHDVTDLKQAEEALEHSEQRFREMVDLLPQVVFELDLTGRVIFGNRNCYETFGYSELDYARGINAFNSIIPEDRNRMQVNMQRVIAGDNPTFNEYTILRTDGSTFPALIYSSPIIRQGVPVGVRGIIVDITERKQAEERLNDLAYFDPLTHLPNRTQFRERLPHVLTQAKIAQEHIAVLLLDLDCFKEVNDTLGHGIGDQLLQVVARRLTACVRSADHVYRLGGDEFIIILPEVGDVSCAEVMTKRIGEALAQSFAIGGCELNITASIGVSLYPEDGEDLDALLKYADLAMYTAKARGKGTYAFFESEMDRDLSEKMHLTRDLRKALERNEFRVFYQPILSLHTAKIVGAEALVRWEHPSRGLLLPEKFVPLAEDLGMIGMINEWVLSTACTQNMHWRSNNLPAIRLAVNISPDHLLQPDLIEYIKNVTAHVGFPTCDLEIEITENAAMQNCERIRGILEALQALGIQIALDDFGTGYSSLGYLQKYPIQTLKIDRSFIYDIPANEDNTTIVSAIIALARTLHIKVVAEGVETPEQLALLRSLTSDEAQGFLLGHPMPADEFTEMLAASTRAPLTKSGYLLHE